MSTPATARPAHLGWRLLALVYDLFPLLALLMAGSAIVLLVGGGRPVQAGSPAALGELAFLWMLCGGYAVLSWQRGGQTLGMRPWRLQVLAENGSPAAFGALAMRYLVATGPALLLLALMGYAGQQSREWLCLPVALALLGLGWGLFDARQRGWHDLASGTLMVRRDA